MPARPEIRRPPPLGLPVQQPLVNSLLVRPAARLLASAQRWVRLSGWTADTLPTTPRRPRVRPAKGNGGA